MNLANLTYMTEMPKWTILSVRKQFVQRTENIPVFFEETVKQNNKETLYVELRIDGPFVRPSGTRDEYEATIEVNALLNEQYNEKDTIRLFKLGGVVIQALVQDFCIYKLGPEVTDDKTFWETYQLITDDQVELSNFGQVDTTNKIYQATVEAHYKVRFKNGTVRP